ncbi:MAG: hypothetical protein Ct9H300mP1_24650 [Planctomycetaceae bacterium]|nr:MAG: hypothetical protein Ct9H300mP1_24650 [Planctomycetaceae bacterium]
MRQRFRWPRPRTVVNHSCERQLRGGEFESIAKLPEKIHQVSIVGVLVFVVDQFAVGSFVFGFHPVGHGVGVFIKTCRSVGQLIGRNVVVEDGGVLNGRVGRLVE